VLTLSKTLASLSHEVTILTCQPDSSNTPQNFQVSTINSVKLMGLRLVRPAELIHFLLEKRFDVCHLHHQTFFGEAILLVNKTCKLPTVTTLHTQMIRRLPARLLYDRISLRFISTLSSKVICLSPNIMQDLVRRGLERSKCVVVPNGIDLWSLKSQFREIGKGLSAPECDLLFVGRLEERKGIIWLLKSLILLHRQGKKYTLKIVGHGPLAQELDKIITANNLTQHVKLSGYVSQQELLRCYLLAKVVVIPSLYEGLPTVTLEAMVAGKPLIVSNIPGLNELVVNEGNGLVVNPMDTSGLASAIDEVLSYSICFNSLDAVNDKILPQFDWKVVGRKIVKTYREILN
jgi:glycosyltransferase involved in cell wall biosynthesis